MGLGLMSNEKAMVREASGFLGELSKPESSLDDNGRMRSYHYHRTMKGIGDLAEAHDDLNETPTESNVPPVKWKPGVGAEAKASPGTPEWEEEEGKEDAHKSHRKMCKAASEFFKELASTRALSDAQREKSAHWHHALNPITKEDPDEEKEESPEENNEAPVEPGEMDTKKLLKMSQKQMSVIEDLGRKLTALNGRMQLV